MMRYLAAIDAALEQLAGQLLKAATGFPQRLVETASNPDEDPSWQDQLQEWLRSTVGPPLKRLHEPVDLWLGGLPMWVAVACVVGLYAVAVIWVWTLRREFVFRGAPDQAWWRDLRLWATLIVIPYVAIYLVLGR